MAIVNCPECSTREFGFPQPGETAADFIAAGKKVPGMHPTLTICRA